MPKSPVNSFSQIVYALIPTVPSLFFGLVIVAQQGLSPTSMSIAFLMVLFSLVAGYFMWVWHSDQVEKQLQFFHNKAAEEKNALMAYVNELERLQLQLGQKQDEQLHTAKELTDQEISKLLNRFSSVNNELKHLFDLLAQPVGESGQEVLDNLAKRVKTIRSEVEAILEALQFEDRSRQIIEIVLNGLMTVKQTLYDIQQQGDNRHQRMLKVDDLLTKVQIQYEGVKVREAGSSPKTKADDLTLF